MTSFPIHRPRMTSFRERRRSVLWCCAALFGLLLVPTHFAQQAQAQSGTGGLLTTLTPTRLYDSRGGVRLGSDETITLQISGRGGVPLGAGAVALNVTAVGPTLPTHLIVWPATAARPGTSNLNLSAGATRPNAVIVGLSASGAINLYNLQGSVDYIIDVTGWFSAGAPAAGGFQPVVPARILDTRIASDITGGGKVGPLQTVKVAVAGRGGVPSTGASAVVLNLTGTEPTAATDVNIWPGTQPVPPIASTLNLVFGETAPNLAIVRLGTDGTVQLQNKAGAVHLVADVMGWFAAGTAGPGGFVPVDPTRVLDSRNGTPLRPKGWMPVKASVGPIPTSGVAAVATNLTAVFPNAATHLTAFPTAPGSSIVSNVPVAVLPNVSSVNAVAGQTVPNAAVVPVGPEASFWLVNPTADMHVIVDVNGYWVGTTPSGNAPAVPAAGPGPGQFLRSVTSSTGAELFWADCGPIVIRIDRTGITAAALDDIPATLSRISRATGLQFVIGPDISLPGPYGDAISTLASGEIGLRFRSATEDAELAGSTIGYAVTSSFSDGEIARAIVTLDTGFTGALGYGPGVTVGALVLHEFAHTMGLGHSAQDLNQLMYPSILRGIDEFGAGDLAGLSLIRRPNCFLRDADSTEELRFQACGDTRDDHQLHARRRDQVSRVFSRS